MTKQELIAQLAGPASVDFTFMPVGKVIELLNELEEPTVIPSGGLTKEEISELASNVAEAIASEGLSVVDDYELSMNYKEVEVDSVEFNERQLKSIAASAIQDFLEDRADRDVD